MKKIILLFTLICLFVPLSFAGVYPMPAKDSDLIGQLKLVKASLFSNVTDISQKYDVGYHELVEANPGMSMDRLRSGEKILIPTRYVLPKGPRKGVLINLAEMRLYYFDNDNHQVLTFPVGIGKDGWATPLGKTHIADKELNPTWVPTMAVRKDFEKKNGFPLPTSFPPGPDNPLGDYAMRLGFHNILIHGTNDPTGVGKRVSAGCIRMFNDDVGALFERACVGLPVTIVNQPFKAGWDGDRLFFEAQRPLGFTQGDKLTGYKKVIKQALKNKPHGVHVKVNWKLAKQIAHLQMGVPEVIAAPSH